MYAALLSNCMLDFRFLRSRHFSVTAWVLYFYHFIWWLQIILPLNLSSIQFTNTCHDVTLYQIWSVELYPFWRYLYRESQNLKISHMTMTNPFHLCHRCINFMTNTVHTSYIGDTNKHKQWVWYPAECYRSGCEANQASLTTVLILWQSEFLSQNPQQLLYLCNVIRRRKILDHSARINAL